MMFVCLWSPRWSIGGESLAERAMSLLEIAPRVVADGGVIWADARGLPEERLARSMLDRLAEDEVRAGISGVPIVAKLAARSGEPGVIRVKAGEERSFLRDLPLEMLEPEPRLRTLLEGVGIRSCGDVAALSREEVEVRLGSPGVDLWRLCRADDPRLLFEPIRPELPSASVDFVEYSVREGERLVFAVNALLGSVCGALVERGERAREMALTLSLSNKQVVRETLRVARPTGERAAWLRRVRLLLERLELPDSVAGISLRVEGTEPVSATQGDLFDRGFATAAPVEEAVARLLDLQSDMLVQPDVSGHPLPERRTSWRAMTPVDAVEGDRPASSSLPRLTLQLLPEPRAVRVRVRRRRDRIIPAGYQDAHEKGEWRSVIEAAGPDRISGGDWEEDPYEREYFRCVTEGGALLWLYRDALADRWFLHGWWD